MSLQAAAQQAANVEAPAGGLAALAALAAGAVGEGAACPVVEAAVAAMAARLGKEARAEADWMAMAVAGKAGATVVLREGGAGMLLGPHRYCMVFPHVECGHHVEGTWWHRSL